MKFRLYFVPLNKTYLYTRTILFICTSFVHNPTKRDFILRSKISLADRQISLRVLLCTRQGWAVGEGCCGGKRQALSKKVATYLSFVLRHAEVSLPEKCKPTYNCQQVVSVAAILPKSTCPKSEKDYEEGVNLLWRHWFAKE